jgi:ubiquinone/menaquinone biosynthesis C-methylase UbiE
MKDPFGAHIAEAYGRHSQKYEPVLEPLLKPMAEEIVELAKLKDGERVLDLATGTGLIARAIAPLADSIVGVDISSGILAIARRLAASTIPFVAADAKRLPFRDQSFDLVTCGISLSHIPEVEEALGEAHRVLRLRGRFITSAWGKESKSATKEAAVEVRKRFLADREIVFEGTLAEEVWADVERGSTILREAGFTDVQVTTLPLSGEHQTSEAAIEAALAWPLTRYRISKLDPADQRRLMEETAAAIFEVDELRWQNEVHYYHATRLEGSSRSA